MFKNSSIVSSENRTMLSFCDTWAASEGGTLLSYRTDKDDKLTSPFASRVFILSKKLDSKILDSSRMKTIFSFLQPARLSTARKSSSKSAAKYLRWIYKNMFEVISFGLWLTR